MSEAHTATLPLQRWQGDRGTYHLVTFSGAIARVLDEAALLHRLEFGRSRGFGSIKLTAQIGETQWRTSVFPQRPNTPKGSESGSDGEDHKDYVLLISKKVMRAEELAPGDAVTITLTV